MLKRTLIVFMLSALLLTSCAPKKEVVKTLLKPVIAPVAEEFTLPVAEPEPEKPEVKKLTRHLEAVLFEEDEYDKYILLNFENTDIQTIISTFSELLQINYILMPGISGTVTIQSYRKFPVSDLFSIFQSILGTNGLTAIKQGSFYNIVPIDTAKQQPLEIKKGLEVSFVLDPSFITQLLPLEHVKASDIANVLRNLMPRGTDIIIYEPSNMLIVTALPPTLSKFMKLIEALDIPETETDAIQTFVYYVENGEAAKLETILKAIYTSDKKKPAALSRAVKATPQRPAAKVRLASLPGDIEGLEIIAYEDINALIIKSTPRAYLSLLDVLKRIDIPPKQVLIETTIAEITLNDTFEFGIEWLAKMSDEGLVGLNLGSVVTSGAELAIPPLVPAFPGGFGAILTGRDANLILKALASKSDLNIIATPTILALDNKEAEIKIGSEVPTATSTQQSTEGITTSSQIQYKTVGTLLSVTPHITEKGNVLMKIVVESSDLGVDQIIGTGKYPSFSTRKATTTAIVKDGHTLFLGGLISEKKNKSRSGIPFLSKLPIIGYLFSSNTTTTDKTELFIMVTPYVINNQEEADAITSRYQNRIKIISKRFSDRIESLGKLKNPATVETEAEQPISQPTQ